MLMSLISMSELEWMQKGESGARPHNAKKCLSMAYEPGGPQTGPLATILADFAHKNVAPLYAASHNKPLLYTETTMNHTSVVAPLGLVIIFLLPNHY